MSISAANREWKAEGASRREKQEQSRNLPSRFQGGTGTDYYAFEVVEGNVLDSTQDGVIYVDDIIDEVPAAYDPETDTSFIDGICRGRVYKNGVMLDGYFLGVNDQRGMNRNAVLAGQITYAGGPVSIDVAGGGTVKAFTLG